MLEQVFQYSTLKKDVFDKEKEALCKIVKYKMPALDYASGRTSYAVRRYEFTYSDAETAIMYATKSLYSKIISLELGFSDSNPCQIKTTDNKRIAITVPRKDQETLWLGDGISEMRKKPYENGEFIAYVGETSNGEAAIIDFNMTPHWIIAGTTGAGKTVCIMDILLTLMERYSPDELNLYLADNKNTITHFDGIKHVKMQANNNEDILILWESVVKLFEERKELLGGSDIIAYNEDHPDKKLPRILVVFDEADNVISRGGGESADAVRECVRQIAAEGRSAGIHVILASQKPVGANIDTRITSNVPGRIALKTANRRDSLTILDHKGAEKLAGNGDAFFRSTNTKDDERIQCAFATRQEIEKAKDVLRNAYGSSET